MADILDELLPRGGKAALEAMMNRSPKASRNVDGAAIAATLKSRIFGQDHVADAIAEQIELRFARTKRTQPIGVFLLLGPPSTGKTQFAKELSRALFDDKDAKQVYFIEGSSFSTEASASTLFGSPQGYAGGPGQLTSALAAKPDRLILIDEIEKIHPSIILKFLSSWQDGFCTCLRNGKVSTTEALYILTSNACQKEVAALADNFRDDPEALSDAIKEQLKAAGIFAPEVLSRVDACFAFLPLEGLNLCRVAAIKLKDEIEGGYDVKIDEIDPQILFNITEAAKDRRADIREVIRMIQKTAIKQVVALKRAGVGRVRLLAADDGSIIVEAA